MKRKKIVVGALAIPIKLRRGKDAAGREVVCHGAECRAVAPYIGRSFDANGNLIEVFPADRHGNRLAILSSCECALNSAGNSVSCRCAGECNCENGKVGSMSNELTETEKAICAAFGNSESEYLAVKRARAARIAGGAGFVPALMARSKSGAHGIIGPGIVQEAFFRHQPEMESAPVTAEQLAAEAASAIGDFQKQSATPDAWKTLARAAALLTGALDLIGPAYADRVDAKGNWK